MGIKKCLYWMWRHWKSWIFTLWSFYDKIFLKNYIKFLFPDEFDMTWWGKLLTRKKLQNILIEIQVFAPFFIRMYRLYTRIKNVAKTAAKWQKLSYLCGVTAISWAQFLFLFCSNGKYPAPDGTNRVCIDLLDFDWYLVSFINTVDGVLSNNVLSCMYICYIN